MRNPNNISIQYSTNGSDFSEYTTATELKYRVYYNTFYGCKALNYVKLNIVNWNSTYTQNWLVNVASTGVVECPADSTIPSNTASGIPSGWTRVNF